MAHELTERTDERCCGACKFMECEDTDGYGYCCTRSIRDMEVHCSDVCDLFKERN